VTCPPTPARLRCVAFAGPGGEEVRTVEREPPARGEAPAPAADAPSSSGGALAGAAVALGAAIFVATKFAMPGPSLAELERDAVPLEEALRNGKPTVMEFYADWCKVCQLMAADTYDVERAHRDGVNFVMLNVDNTKWAPEMAEFGVPGIPEYVFLDAEGRLQAIAVGQVPKNVLAADFEALEQGRDLPYARIKSEFSELQGPGRAMAGPRPTAQPLSHGV